MTASELSWNVVLFAIGLGGLYVGAEGFVRGSAGLAERLGISRLVIGLTLVAFGTSAPELAVSLLAALKDTTALAVGNVVGSNIANIGLILAIAALIRPLKVRSSIVRREVPFMIAVSLLFYLLALNGAISRLDGSVLIATLGLFLALMFVYRAEGLLEEAEDPLEAPLPLEASPSKTKALVLSSLLALGGLLVLLVGARLLVDSAVVLARAFGISEGVIGLSLVAVGTSLPELATSVVAALRRETAISVGNIVGSNIFNLLSVIGLVALVQPLPVAGDWLRLEIPVMLLFSLALVPVLGKQARVERWEGGLLLVGYFAFLGWIFR
jgi:cation:H+ antiporter